MNKLALLVGVLGLAQTARAEDAPQIEQPQKLLGVDAAVVVPVGDYSKIATVGGGALARLEFPIAGTGGFVYGRAGVIFHQLDDRVEGSLTFVPLYVGYRHPFGGGAYVAGELGITIGIAEVDTQLGQMSDSDSDLGLMVSAGMRRGKLDLRGGLFLPDAEEMGLMASAGFDFASF